MLDPPRHDTARTIRNLVSAGIKVKVKSVYESMLLIISEYLLSNHLLLAHFFR